MTKDIKDILNKFNTVYQKDVFDKDISNIIHTIKNTTGITLNKTDIYLKNNILKIKASSNIRFKILLHLNRIKSDFIIEL